MQIAEYFVARLAVFFNVLPTRIQLKQLMAKKLVADATEKMLVNVNCKPSAFLIISPKNSPNTVKSATDKAIKFAQIVGVPLAYNIVIPDLVDTYEGLSYAIFPYYQTFTTLPLVKIFVRRRIAHQIVHWLKAIAKKTAHPANESEIAQSFVAPLTHFLKAPNLPENYAQITSKALQAIKDERWKPKFVATHNDLWSGNVMHSDEYGFVVIDWDSSLIQGYAFYDIVRVSHSYTINRFASKKVLREYCQEMGCSSEEASFYLMTAFAYLYQHLGEWPYESFLATMHESMDYLTTHMEQ